MTRLEDDVVVDCELRMGVLSGASFISPLADDFLMSALADEVEVTTLSLGGDAQSASAPVSVEYTCSEWAISSIMDSSSLYSLSSSSPSRDSQSCESNFMLSLKAFMMAETGAAEGVSWRLGTPGKFGGGFGLFLGDTKILTLLLHAFGLFALMSSIDSITSVSDLNSA
jgi:hypothetical protein